MHFVLMKQKWHISNLSKVRGFCSIYLFFRFQLDLFLLKQVIWKNALLDLIRAMFIKSAITQLIMGLSDKVFHLNDP